jgi:hypothetical protein
MEERGIGDPVHVGHAGVLGEEERERVRPVLLDAVRGRPAAGLFEYRACLVWGQVDPEIRGLHAFPLGSRTPVCLLCFAFICQIMTGFRRAGLGQCM